MVIKMKKRELLKAILSLKEPQITIISSILAVILVGTIVYFSTQVDHTPGKTQGEVVGKNSDWSGYDLVIRSGGYTDSYPVDEHTYYMYEIGDYIHLWEHPGIWKDVKP